MNAPDPFNIDDLHNESVSQIHKRPRAPRHRVGEAFLKGPIPLLWLSSVAALPGKAMAVGLAIWWRVGLRKTAEIRLTGSHLKRFGVGRKAGYRCLAAMERDGLIRVQRQRGKAPIVTVLCDSESSDNIKPRV